MHGLFTFFTNWIHLLLWKLYLFKHGRQSCIDLVIYHVINNMFYYFIVASLKLLLISDSIEISLVTLLVIGEDVLVLEVHNRINTWRLVDLMSSKLLLVHMKLVLTIILLLILILLSMWIEITIRSLFLNGTKSVPTLENWLTSWLNLLTSLVRFWSWSLTTLLARKTCSTALKFLCLEFSKKFDQEEHQLNRNDTFINNIKLIIILLSILSSFH